MTNLQGARAALLAGLLTGAAFASEASVTLTSTLDFGDATITTATSFSTTGDTTYVTVYAPTATASFAGNWYSPVSVTVPSAGGSAYASGSADSTSEVATIVNLASTVNVDRFGEILLAAGQNVIITIPYTLGFSVTGGTTGAIGEADVQLQLLTADTSGNFTLLAANSTAQVVAPGTSTGHRLAINFTNTSSAAVDYRLAFNADAMITTVPEPSSLALMLIGITGVAGLAARRRKR